MKGHKHRPRKTDTQQSSEEGKDSYLLSPRRDPLSILDVNISVANSIRLGLIRLSAIVCGITSTISALHASLSEPTGTYCVLHCWHLSLQTRFHCLYHRILNCMHSLSHCGATGQSKHTVGASQRGIDVARERKQTQGKVIEAEGRGKPTPACSL